MASEVKTNKISPSTSTTVTLGDASDLFQLPASAEIDIASGATLDVNGNIDFTGATVTGLTTGKILQVVHTSVTAATFSTSSTSAVDITGMTLDITPAATSSKILLMAVVNFDMSATTAFAAFTALRDGSAVDSGIGDAAGSRIRCAAWGSSYSNQATVSRSMTFLDSPSSTSAVTYKLQVDLDAGTIYLNRSTTDTDNTSFGRTISTLTAMEVGV